MTHVSPESSASRSGTLTEWLAGTGLYAHTLSTGERVIPPYVPQSELWGLCHLADYRVISYSGGSYWLIPIVAEEAEEGERSKEGE